MSLQAVSASAKPSGALQGAKALGPLFNLASGYVSSPSLNLLSSSAGSGLRLVLARTTNKGFVISASTEALTGIVFQPFEELKSEEFFVPIAPNVSLTRQRYSDDCEAAINDQINAQYYRSYVYHAMYAYFDRDNIALKGLAKFFKESSKEKREHAEKLMEYQNIRGGSVKLHSMVKPPSEFDHAEKGDALYAMELALAMEKLTNSKLLFLHSVAAKNNDAQMQEFIESEFLGEQVESIKKIANYVTQLRMVGKGHGVWHFDQMLFR